MLAETIQLETLRQKIEDVDYESGSKSDYLDRMRPKPSEAKQVQEAMDKLNEESKALKTEFKELLTSIRSQQPQAIEEWVEFHTSILQRILEEKDTDRMAATRRFVAKNTLAEWEKVRLGEQDYVSINWYFLKDYREGVRPIGTPRISQGNAKIEEQRRHEGKAWWQFWK
jgi:hypothetical protein